jgi:hypothetical protein
MNKPAKQIRRTCYAQPGQVQGRTILLSQLFQPYTILKHIALYFRRHLLLVGATGSVSIQSQL